MSDGVPIIKPAHKTPILTDGGLLYAYETNFIIRI